MSNNDDQLQQQYQEILNKYASTITPPTSEPDPKPEAINLVEQPVVTPVEAPIIEPQPVNLLAPPIYFPPEPKVETKPSNFFKYLFYFSLLLFIAVATAIIYNFSTLQQPDTSTNTPPTAIPSVANNKFCELSDKKYSVGESFLSEDKCNTCSCTTDLTIACTEKACVTPTAVATPKPVSGKLYKDIKYGYQFTCPTGAKYVLEATSVNGNKIPFKQESCSESNNSVIISVYDNTIVHSFGSLKTQISLDKKYIYTIEGDGMQFNTLVESSFKLL